MGKQQDLAAIRRLLEKVGGPLPNPVSPAEVERRPLR